MGVKPTNRVIIDGELMLVVIYFLFKFMWFMINF